jgi:hypothetical protein
MERFSLTDDQMKKVTAWCKKHTTSADGAIGGTFTFSFTPTSLGVIERVKHNPSGEELDVTEYDSW